MRKPRDYDSELKALSEKAGWRERGAAFFQRTARSTPKRVDPVAGGASPNHGSAASE